MATRTGNRWFWVCALSLMAAQVAAAPPSPQNPQVVPAGPAAFVLVGDMDVPNRVNQGLISNSTFVITDAGVVVIDSGGSRQIGELLLREIRRRTDKPVTHVINTHHHADHWMGNDAFARLKPRPQILGHATMRAIARTSGPQWLTNVARMTGGANRGTEVVLPTAAVAGGERLRVGDKTFVLYHPAHAHTEGDIAVFVPETGLLIAGDVVFYHRTPGWQDADPLANAAAIDEFLKLNPRHVVPGHGPVSDARALRWMRDYIARLQGEVQKHMDAGLSDYEMKDKLDIGDYRHMSGFADRFGLNVSKMYLALEAQGFK